jgi:hypothetical protein
MVLLANLRRMETDKIDIGLMVWHPSQPNLPILLSFGPIHRAGASSKSDASDTFTARLKNPQRSTKLHYRKDIDPGIGM